MFAATLTLRRVWLQVAMKIKLMFFTPIKILFIGGANFNVMMIMTIVSVEQPLSWGRMFKPVH